MEAYMIIDGQWGSSGKGLIAGKLALERKPDVVVCNFGPNAGHTFINNGVHMMTQQLPTGAVAGLPNEEYSPEWILIGPGAIIDPEIFLTEIEKFNVNPARIVIHPHAAIVTEHDKHIERLTMGDIGSTKKGVGNALCRKIARVGETPLVAKDYRDNRDLHKFVDWEYNNILQKARLVQIESAQGFELSLNHGTMYPKVTSRDVTPEAILNDVGIPRRFLKEVIATYRTFPIRVGHELNEKGEIIGHSGPIYTDMKELTWADIPMAREERTTVTNKVRRVFTWSWAQFARSLHMIGPCSIFMNFMNYLPPSEEKKFTEELLLQANYINGSNVNWLGYGPSYDNVVDL